MFRNIQCICNILFQRFLLHFAQKGCFQIIEIPLIDPVLLENVRKTLLIKTLKTHVSHDFL